ncbi:hypothetical protein ACTFIW_003958 [Dictyostelium discoideum]
MITKVEYLINPDNQFNNGPISIILGYAGSTLRILKNYAKIWHDRGFNTILSPHSIMICFHVLSAGSMFLGKLLESMKKKNEFNYLFSLIKGVVYDSAPLLDENKWPHLILTSPNDFVILSIYDFIDQIKLIPGMKEFKDFNNNSDSNNNNNNNNNNCFNNLYIIEKVFQSEHCLHLLKNPKEYIESVNQLIDLAFLNEKNQLQSLIKL